MTSRGMLPKAGIGCTLAVWMAGSAGALAGDAPHTCGLADVSRLVVRPFDHVVAPGESATALEARDAAAQTFRARLTEQLWKKRIEVVAGDDPRAGLPGTLLVDGVFTSLHAGAQPDRRVFGFGSANVRVALKVVIRDAHTSQLVTEFARHRSFRIGFINGTDRELLLREARSVASELADFITASVVR